MLSAALLLGLVATVSCLPPGGVPRGSTLSAASSLLDPRVDHRLDLLLGLSRRLSDAVTPLLEAYLTRIVESLPEDYLDKLVLSIRKGTHANVGLDADPSKHQVRYFEDDDKLQQFEDYNNVVINKSA